MVAGLAELLWTVVAKTGKQYRFSSVLFTVPPFPKSSETELSGLMQKTEHEEKEHEELFQKSAKNQVRVDQATYEHLHRPGNS